MGSALLQLNQLGTENPLQQQFFNAQLQNQRSRLKSKGSLNILNENEIWKQSKVSMLSYYFYLKEKEQETQLKLEKLESQLIHYKYLLEQQKSLEIQHLEKKQQQNSDLIDELTKLSYNFEQQNNELNIINNQIFDQIQHLKIIYDIYKSSLEGEIQTIENQINDLKETFCKQLEMHEQQTAQIKQNQQQQFSFIRNNMQVQNNEQIKLTSYNEQLNQIHEKDISEEILIHFAIENNLDFELFRNMKNGIKQEINNLVMEKEDYHNKLDEFKKECKENDPSLKFIQSKCDLKNKISDLKQNKKKIEIYIQKNKNQINILTKNLNNEKLKKEKILISQDIVKYQHLIRDSKKELMVLQEKDQENDFDKNECIDQQQIENLLAKIEVLQEREKTLKANSDSQINLNKKTLEDLDVKQQNIQIQHQLLDQLQNDIELGLEQFRKLDAEVEQLLENMEKKKQFKNGYLISIENIKLNFKQ